MLFRINKYYRFSHTFSDNWNLYVSISIWNTSSTYMRAAQIVCCLHGNRTDTRADCRLWWSCKLKLYLFKNCSAHRARSRVCVVVCMCSRTFWIRKLAVAIARSHSTMERSLEYEDMFCLVMSLFMIMNVAIVRTAQTTSEHFGPEWYEQNETHDERILAQNSSSELAACMFSLWWVQPRSK